MGYILISLIIWSLGITLINISVFIISKIVFRIIRKLFSKEAVSFFNLEQIYLFFSFSLIYFSLFLFVYLISRYITASFTWMWIWMIIQLIMSFSWSFFVYKRIMKNKKIPTDELVSYILSLVICLIFITMIIWWAGSMM
jgi:hypothetical protein